MSPHITLPLLSYSQLVWRLGLSPLPSWGIPGPRILVVISEAPPLRGSAGPPLSDLPGESPSPTQISGHPELGPCRCLHRGLLLPRGLQGSADSNCLGQAVLKAWVERPPKARRGGLPGAPWRREAQAGERQVSGRRDNSACSSACLVSGSRGPGQAPCLLPTVCN